MLYRLRDGVTVENFGEEFVLYDGAKGAVHRVSAAGAPWLVELLSGNVVEVDEISVSQMLNAGLLVTHKGQDWSGSRRRVLAMATSVTAAVGLTTLLLPSAAAAASVYGNPPNNFAIGYGEQDDRYSLTISPFANEAKFFIQYTNDPSYSTNTGQATFRYSVSFTQGGTPISGFNDIGPFTGSAFSGVVPGWGPGGTIFVTVNTLNPTAVPFGSFTIPVQFATSP